MFEFLFKYSAVVYQEGLWAFRAFPGRVWALLIFLAVIATVALLYRRTITPASGFLRSALAGLKIAAIVLLLLSLAEPFLSITTIIPKKGTIVVLIDDSESMGITEDGTDRSRLEKVVDWYGTQQQPGVQQALEKNFNVLTYRFSEKVRPVEKQDSLRAGGKFTDLARALQFAELQSRSYPVTSVILATDGVQTAMPATQLAQESGQPDPLEAAALLKNAGIPIYTVGVGSEVQNDVQLAKVSSSHSVTENDIVQMTALIHTRRPTGERTTLELLEDGKIITRQDVVLNAKYNRVTITHKPTKKGYLQYTARITPTRDEIIKVNNSSHFLVNNEDRIARILYVEELHPWDFKFLKRALDLDKSLQLVSLVRTGPDRFLRQGIANPNELADGFPKTKDELFAYQAVILGSIEASFLTAGQQALLRDFVSERGGGLLMLGGPKSFSEGSWDGTAVEEILPVELLPAEEAAKQYANPLRLKDFTLQLTPEGLRSAILQFSTDAAGNRSLWASLPPLQGFNPVGRARPGATVLAVHPLSQPGREKIIMAEQRYGRGRSMILATSSSWLWQMHLPHTDMRHETFWRQIARWLALSAPDPVAVALGKDNFSPGEKVAFHVNALDSSFRSVDNAQISVRVTLPYNSEAPAGGGTAGRGDPPVGSLQTVNVLPDLNRPGEYKAAFVPEREGLYEVEVMAHDPTGKFLGRASSAFFVSENHAEFANPDMQEALLQRIADISDGKYMPIDEAHDIADDIAVAKSSYAKTVERDLWDSPAVFFAILLLLGAEWFTRRAKGLS